MDMMDILMAKTLSEGGGGSGLPDVGPSDAGKVATVNVEGEWDAETPAAVPTVTPNPEGEATADLTKLGINNDIYGIPKELPAVTASDNGKVLGVAEGAWGKVSPSGGLPDVSSSDNGSILSVINGQWGKYNGLKNVAIYNITPYGNNKYKLVDTSVTFDDIITMLFQKTIMFVYRFNDWYQLFIGCGYRTYNTSAPPLFITFQSFTYTSTDTPTLSIKMYEINKRNNTLDYIKDVL